MSAPTFSPFKNPVIGMPVTTSYRTLDAGFGDGYSQVTIDGLNAQVDSVKTLQWVNLTLAQLQSITSQLDTFAGTTFAYQLPTDSTPKLWRCKTRTIDDSDAVVLTLSISLEQAFDLS